MPKKLIGSLDSGTQSTRFILYDEECNVVCSSQVDIPLMYPKAG